MHVDTTKPLYLSSPYGFIRLSPFNVMVDNGTRLEFCHILQDKLVCKVYDKNSNIRIEIPELWISNKKDA